MSRDHRAAYARRNELAREQGYANYREARAARAAGAPLATDRTARPDRRQITSLGTGNRRHVKPAGHDQRAVASQLGKADRVTIRMPDGRTVYGKGGISADVFRRMVIEHGSIGAAVQAALDGVYGDGAGDEGPDPSDFVLDLW